MPDADSVSTTVTIPPGSTTKYVGDFCPHNYNSDVLPGF